MAAVRNLTYLEAINAALRRALTEWDDTFILGEDVGRPGGVFGATKGLKRDFGDRVLDTPISESAILGGALGAALMGQRPIAEIMWVDFSLVAFDQIANQAANVSFLSRGSVRAPLTIRTQQGALPGSCAQHSQCLEALFAHIPGIRVGLPATPQDAYDMLLTAVDHDDPVVVIESRGLYFGSREPVTLGEPVKPLEGATVRLDGVDVTLVTWGTMVGPSISAAGELRDLGVSAEVIDLRWLNPLDMTTVLASVAKTSRLVIAHEANVTGGFGAEVAARVAEQGIHLLDAPIVRVGLPDSRVPAAPHLQEMLLPSASKIATAVAALVHAHQ